MFGSILEMKMFNRLFRNLYDNFPQHLSVLLKFVKRSDKFYKFKHSPSRTSVLRCISNRLSRVEEKL